MAVGHRDGEVKIGELGVEHLELGAELEDLDDQLEIRRGQAAHRIAARVDHGHRNFDDVDIDGLLDLRKESQRSDQKSDDPRGLFHRVSPFDFNTVSGTPDLRVSADPFL